MVPVLIWILTARLLEIMMHAYVIREDKRAVKYLMHFCTQHYCVDKSLLVTLVS